MREYMLGRYHDRRNLLIKERGGRCLECGSKEDLDFHHVDPATKSFTISDKLASANIEKIREELKKCNLICNDCHKDKHHKKGL